MKVLNLALIFPLFVACSGSSSNSSGGSDNRAKQEANKSSNSSCVVKKVNGSLLLDGSQDRTVNLVRQSFNGSNTIIGEQVIYGEGRFPNDYSIIEQLPSSISHEELLAQAKAWKWSLGSKKDEKGNWTILTLYKEILDESNANSYVVDSRDFSYGESIGVVDQDTDIDIKCSVPK